MKKIVYGLCLAALFSCSPRLYQSSDETQFCHDTVFVLKVKVDSIWRRDSIYIREKGDTVYKYVEHVRDRYSIVHDTTYISVTDTLRIYKYEEIPVEKSLTKWQSLSIVAGRLCLIAVFLLLIWLAVKKFVLKL